MNLSTVRPRTERPQAERTSQLNGFQLGPKEFELNVFFFIFTLAERIFQLNDFFTIVTLVERVHLSYKNITIDLYLVRKLLDFIAFSRIVVC